MGVRVMSMSDVDDGWVGGIESLSICSLGE